MRRKFSSLNRCCLSLLVSPVPVVDKGSPHFRIGGDRNSVYGLDLGTRRLGSQGKTERDVVTKGRGTMGSMTNRDSTKSFSNMRGVGWLRVG